MYALPSSTQTATLPAIALGNSCGYRIDDDRVLVNLSQVANNRDFGDLSGTLSVELWALCQPYTSGDFDGVALAGTAIGELSGQHLLADCRYDLLFKEPPAGTWHLTLMLREWTAVGYVTRD